MRHFRLVAPVALLALFVGCAGITPGNDPVVVRAEAAETTATEAFNALFTTEGQNHAFIKAHTPQVSAAVNRMRIEGPKAVDTLVAVVRAYKNNRTAENKANIVTAIAVVRELINQSKNYLTQIGGA
jgi:hypothetical protein